VSIDRSVRSTVWTVIKIYDESWYHNVRKRYPYKRCTFDCNGKRKS